MGITIDTSKIESRLKSAINSAMQGEVQEIIKETESKHAMSDVYGAYAPSYYGRRGSLADEGNMQAQTGDMEVVVTNIASFNNAYDWNTTGPRMFIPPPNSGQGLASLVENGGHYNYPYGDFTGARPFIANTRAELQGNNRIRDAIASAIGAAGFSVS